MLQFEVRRIARGQKHDELLRKNDLTFRFFWNRPILYLLSMLPRRVIGGNTRCSMLCVNNTYPRFRN